MSLVSIFGMNLSTNDILLGLMALAGPIVIVVACYIAKTGRVEVVAGILFIIVIVMCIGGAAR